MQSRPLRAIRRRGVTLIELLIAASISAMLIAALGGMARAVYRSNEYSEGYGSATQHAQVVIDRISTKISKATANADYPGVFVIADTVSGYRFPDTLVVWSPATVAANPTGKPKISELVVYCPNPTVPNELVEITLPSDNSDAPAATDTTAWKTAITNLKANNLRQQVVLTDLMRVGVVTELSASDPSAKRGCVRFELRVSPSTADYASYKAGTKNWNELIWAQGIFGTQFGLRQSWVRFELQLDPSVPAALSSDTEMPPVTFFGSGALYYNLGR